MQCFFIVSFMLSAEMQHLLNFQHVARASIRASFEHKLDEVSEFLVLDQFAHFD